MPENIRFGTDGWRGVIARDFTVSNVIRVSEAVATWLKRQVPEPLALIGWDTRFNSQLFANAVLHVFRRHGIRVLLPAEPFITTPVLSYNITVRNATAGIMLTASHNPFYYHGYKIRGGFGGPIAQPDMERIEELIPEQPTIDPYAIEAAISESDRTSFLDAYIQAVLNYFPIEQIQSIQFAYDAMYGAGQIVFKQLFSSKPIIRAQHNPLFPNTYSPEPIPKHLEETIRWMQRHPEIEVCLVTDGDADRLGVITQGGRYLTPHHVVLILLHLSVVYWKLSGRVLITVSMSERIRRYCNRLGIECEIVPVGFKHIAPVMADPTSDVLLGAEESGGYAIKGHIPERDGLWSGLLLLKGMLDSGKSLNSLLLDIFKEVGDFVYLREDIRLKHRIDKSSLVRSLVQLDELNGWQIIERIDIDGAKLILEGDRWVLVRPSGTEPLLRIYAEGNNRKEAILLIEAVKEVVGKVFNVS